MKKILSIAAAVLYAAFCAVSCAPKKTASGASRLWTDSTGREVALPAKIERIAPSGPLAQIILYSLCPDKVIGWASAFSEAQKRFIPEKYWNKPTFGQFYGRSATMNLEAVIAAKPDLLIDLGEIKPNIKEDMSSLSEQIGVPVVFVEATLESMSAAYRALGALLGEEERASELAAYIDETFADAAARRARVPQEKRISVYMGDGKGGLQTNGRGSIHADIIEYAGGINAAALQAAGTPLVDKAESLTQANSIRKSGKDAAFSAGLDGVSLEQVLLWNPDVIILGSGISAAALAAESAWQPIRAVQEGRVYDVPQQPWSWTGRPPSVNRLIGIKWLGNILYPDVFDYDMAAEARRFYRLFYHADYDG